MTFYMHLFLTELMFLKHKMHAKELKFYIIIHL